MIYALDNKKYIAGNREPKQTSLSILKLQKLQLEDSFIYRTNFIDNDALFWVISGCIEYENKKIESGNVIYVSKYSGFSFCATKPTELFEIVFNYSEKIPLTSNKFQIIKVPLDTQGLFIEMHRNNSFSDNLPGVNEGLLLNIINTLNILCISCTVGLNLYCRCSEWIEQNALYPITAECAAEAMGCTVAHLNRTVKKHSSKCLSEIIEEARIEVIKKFVKYSNNSTQEIACKLGFGTSELLRKFFKYHTGISLNEYKKQCYKM